jgi:hypothetical protein
MCGNSGIILHEGVVEFFRIFFLNSSEALRYSVRDFRTVDHVAGFVLGAF